MKGKMFTLDSGLRGFWTAGKSHILPLFASVVLIVLGNLISPGFAKLSNIANILTMSSILIIAAIAQLLVVVTGEEGIDLSIGAVMSMGCLPKSCATFCSCTNFFMTASAAADRQILPKQTKSIFILPIYNVGQIGSLFILCETIRQNRSS